ncbi:MAG: T9SS type A sorting domain-containing protein [Chitinispirillia bacterium]|nr:T9SS type A sorting domain-containing protein [Chitinispirillia bacterium]
MNWFLSRKVCSVAIVMFFGALVLSGNAFSQEIIDAQIPVLVNAGATVKIDPPAGSNKGTGDEGSVTANTQKTFNIKLVKDGASPVSHQPQKQARAGAWVSHSNGNITLNLNSQQYQNAAVSLHTVNGKRVLSGNASASKGTGSISHANIPAGVYLLSVKGTKGSSFTSKLTHNGDKLNINVAFAEDSPSLRKSAADNYGEWTITVSAAGYFTQTRSFSPIAGLNTLQNFTLVSDSGEDGKYSLSITRDPTAGGKVFVGNVESTGTTLHNAETPVDVRAEAALGYRFTGWTGTLTNTNASLTVNMRMNITLTANFEYVGTRTLTISRVPADGGTVRVNNVVSSGITTHITGAQVSVTAAANTGYIFTGWTGASTSANTTITVTISSDLTLTANFEEVETGTFTDTRDNKTYKWVKIGAQTWMAENLNFSTHLLGNSWCYNSSPDSCAKYGRLYDWDAAMGACPDGWHLPTSQEWDVLLAAVGGASTAGTMLKSTTGWNNNGNGTDDFGFSALPAGLLRSTNGTFNDAGNGGLWWSATVYSSGSAWCRNMVTGYANVGETYNVKGSGFSARCVR